MEKENKTTDQKLNEIVELLKGVKAKQDKLEVDFKKLDKKINQIEQSRSFIKDQFEKHKTSS